MIRRFLFAFALLFPAMALAQQHQLPLVAGLPYLASNSNNTNTLNATATWFAWGFNISDAKTLNNVSFYCTAETGTVEAADVGIELYAANTSNGGPAAAATEARTLDADVTGCPGWIDVTGFTTALSADTQYFIVMKNLDGSPASNFLTVARQRIPTLGDAALAAGNNNNSGWGWSFRTSTDSGTTWALGNGSSGWGGLRLGFSGGTYAGIPFSHQVEDSDEGRGTQEVGPMFTVPADGPGLRVKGIAFPINWNGTKPAQMRYRLYSGSGTTPTLVATTTTVEDEAVEQNNWQPLRFSSTQTLSPGTTYRVVMGVVSGGSSGNGFTLNRFTARSDAASRTLIPWDIKGTFSSDGTTFSAGDDTKIFPFALILDTSDPYDMPATTPAKRSTFNRGFN